MIGAYKMSYLQLHILIGVFALLTAVLAGAAVGRLLGLSAGEAAYLSMLLLAAVSWLTGQRARRQEEQL